jgi:hypothetical protein
LLLSFIKVFEDEILVVYRNISPSRHIGEGEARKAEPEEIRKINNETRGL